MTFRGNFVIVQFPKIIKPEIHLTSISKRLKLFFFQTLTSLNHVIFCHFRMQFSGQFKFNPFFKKGKISKMYKKKVIYSSSFSSNSISERSRSSSSGITPSLPSHEAIFFIWGKSAPLTGAVRPLPKEISLKNSLMPS